MRYITYNFVSILLVLLASYMVYAGKANYGWVIFAALLCAVYPKDNNDDTDLNMGI